MAEAWVTELTAHEDRISIAVGRCRRLDERERSASIAGKAGSSMGQRLFDAERVEGQDVTAVSGVIRWPTTPPARDGLQYCCWPGRGARSMSWSERSGSPRSRSASSNVGPIETALRTFLDGPPASLASRHRRHTVALRPWRRDPLVRSRVGQRGRCSPIPVLHGPAVPAAVLGGQYREPAHRALASPPVAGTGGRW